MEDIKIIKDYKEAKENGTLSEMPEALDGRCRELIEEAFTQPRCRSRSKHISAFIARAAVVVLLLFGLSTVMVLSVDAFRVPVLNFLLDNSGKYCSVVLDANAQHEVIAVASVAERFESAIPNEYRLVDQESSTNHGTITYENDDGQLLCLLFETEQNHINLDAEDIEYSPVDFGDYYAVFWEKNGYSLMWLDNENQVIYRLWASDLDKSEFWKLAYALIA